MVAKIYITMRNFTSEQPTRRTETYLQAQWKKDSCTR